MMTTTTTTSTRNATGVVATTRSEKTRHYFRGDKKGDDVNDTYHSLGTIHHLATTMTTAVAETNNRVASYTQQLATTEM